MKTNKHKREQAKINENKLKKWEIINTKENKPDYMRINKNKLSQIIISDNKQE